MNEQTDDTPTPRTDVTSNFYMRDHARTLERELTAALAQVDELRREKKETHTKTDSMFLSMSKQLDAVLAAIKGAK